MAGGSILTGVLTVGMEVEIRPGIVTKDAQGKHRCRPIFSRIVSLLAENNNLKFAVPGGLIGVGTRIDPTLCRADRLVGQVLGAVGKLPSVYTGKSKIEVQHLVYDFFRIRNKSIPSSPTFGSQDRGQKTNQGTCALASRSRAGLLTRCIKFRSQN